jgi:acyl-[acyl-carrier-protein]-phospholipid O-acyltransferase / long-chain-fatty-acid--[acyl-carrier-protein] ligase
VSMTAAEALVASLWPESQHAVISVADARKGEALLLVTSRQNADVREILALARARTIPEIMVPRAVLCVKSVPLLGTGKVDYPAVQSRADDARTGTLAEAVSA